MAGLRELERKLDSLDGLRDVVTAMRNLSAVFVRRAEDAVNGIRPYSGVVDQALRASLKLIDRPKLGAENSRSRLMVVFGSDQGLCGSFNEKVVDFYAERAADGAVSTVAIGRRTNQALILRGVDPALGVRAPTSLEGIKVQVPELAADVFQAYADHGSGTLDFVFNAYCGMGRYEPTLKTVLPLATLSKPDEVEGDTSFEEPILTAPPAELLSALIEEYFYVEFYRALLESHASENGARLLSMTAAAGNIDDRYEQLRREFQTVRQDTITAELLDVVGGAEALRGCA